MWPSVWDIRFFQLLPAQDTTALSNSPDYVFWGIPSRIQRPSTGLAYNTATLGQELTL